MTVIMPVDHWEAPWPTQQLTRLWFNQSAKLESQRASSHPIGFWLCPSLLFVGQPLEWRNTHKYRASHDTENHVSCIQCDTEYPHSQVHNMVVLIDSFCWDFEQLLWFCAPRTISCMYYSIKVEPEKFNCSFLQAKWCSLNMEGQKDLLLCLRQHHILALCFHSCHYLFSKYQRCSQSTVPWLLR